MIYIAPFPHMLSLIPAFWHINFCLAKMFQMFMEAVLESLKDLEVSKTPDVESSNGQPDPFPKNILDSSTSKQCVPMNEPESNGHTRAKGPESKPPAAGVVNGHNRAKEAESSKASPPRNQSSSSTDMVGHTKATVTVVKNPSGNIMDGLMRRWDLSFFKNR